MDSEILSQVVAFEAQDRPGGAGITITMPDDSMMPTILPGDDLLVDPAQSVVKRDGLYAFVRHGVTSVRRFNLNPADRSVTICPDNKLYACYPDIELLRLHIIGRVVWLGRRA